ncbi:GDSL-type esterase/lipase family protein [Planctomycetaceae bacterium SH139]
MSNGCSVKPWRDRAVLRSLGFVLGLLGVQLVFGQLVCQADEPNDKYRPKAEARWQADIDKLTALNDAEPSATDSVLYIGSSSIRLWETVAEDMAPYPAIKRGYGGARYTDLSVFARQLIEPHRFRAMVMFVANDVTGEEQDTPLEEIETLVRSIIAVARGHQPNAELFIVEVTPSQSRFQAWPQIRQVNALLREVALTETNTHFIPTAEYFLDAGGQPRTEFFRDDQLHLNRAGYTRWAKLIRRHLDDFLD